MNTETKSNFDNKTTQNAQMPVDLSTKTTKILAIGKWTAKGKILEDRLPVMIKEVPATVNLYLTGKIEQWYVKPDISGAVFIMNCTSPAEAHELLEKLPLGIAGMMEFDFIELGPIMPLRYLLKE
ncbi:hypothetical protein EV144_10839 [Flavobacterium sp. 270]|uniref:hypothetical protein n=1 Tax=Flavobacterium sp. 270 TaxID=2512114 RepID=UPI00106479F8|nr:hypothetical protein [Flavobacterium sp. 270]TDW44591.1 hypothetical protein EV144_10839 [Flavobacterium sp. 270]